jgi:hypothetical protein
MKSGFFILGAILALAAFTSCEKNSWHRPIDAKEKPYEKDENATDITWYDRHGNGYYAFFTFDGQNTEVLIRKSAFFPGR